MDDRALMREALFEAHLVRSGGEGVRRGALSGPVTGDPEADSQRSEVCRGARCSDPGSHGEGRERHTEAGGDQAGELISGPLDNRLQRIGRRGRRPNQAATNFFTCSDLRCRSACHRSY